MCDAVLPGLRLPAQILVHKWPAVGCAANLTSAALQQGLQPGKLTCKKSTCKASISAACKAALSASIDVNTHDYVDRWLMSEIMCANMQGCCLIAEKAWKQSESKVS